MEVRPVMYGRVVSLGAISGEAAERFNFWRRCAAAGADGAGGSASVRPLRHACWRAIVLACFSTYTDVTTNALYRQPLWNSYFLFGFQFSFVEYKIKILYLSSMVHIHLYRRKRKIIKKTLSNFIANCKSLLFILQQQRKFAATSGVIMEINDA